VGLGSNYLPGTQKTSIPSSLLAQSGGLPRLLRIGISRLFFQLVTDTHTGTGAFII